MNAYRRAGFAIAVGTIAAIWAAWLRAEHPGVTSDLSQVLWGAEAWLTGLDPYLVVGRTAHLPVPLLYPFPAILIVLPLAALQHEVVVFAIWTFIGTTWLTWALLECGVTPRLIAVLSPAFIMSVQAGQWTPMLMAAGVSRWGGWVLAAKPTTALWWLAYRPRHVIGVAVAGAISIAVWPTWPWSWLPVLQESPYTTWLMTKPAAWLVLLALVRWREPEARLLAAMVLVPHTTLVYETLPLFLVSRTWLQGGVLWLGSMVAVAGHQAMGPYADGAAWSSASGTWLVWCVYLPALGMLLARSVPLFQAGRVAEISSTQET